MQDLSPSQIVARNSGALSREPELMLLCATTQPDATAALRIIELLSSPIDWSRVARLARRHRVIPLVYLNLKKLKSPAVPESALADLGRAFLANAARNLQLSDELLRLLEAFERADIPAIPFKGLALAAEVYGDVSLRDAGDLDVLVHRVDIVRAVDLLESIGHRPIFPTSTPREIAYLTSLTGQRRDSYLRAHSEHHLVREDGRVNVDLHWAIALREFGLPFDIAGIWRRMRETSIRGKTVNAFSPEDLLPVLCVNGAKDCWSRLDRVCDVTELLKRFPDLDWTQLLPFARSAGAMRVLLLGLKLAGQLLDAPLPTHISEQIENDSHVAKLAAQTVADLFADKIPRSAERPGLGLFQLRFRERHRDKLRYCMAHLRPGVGDWALVALPAGLGFLYYLIRPIRLLLRYGLDRASRKNAP